MSLTDAPIQFAQTPASIYQVFLQRVRREHPGSDRKSETSAFDELLSGYWTKLPEHMQRTLVSSAMELFLRLKRTERNRHSVEALIAAVDDINRCPDIGSQTLLEYACGGSGEVDLGLAKALLKAGHCLDRVANGGLSPRQALENLYASKKRHYDQCRILFMTADHKLPMDLPSSRRLKTPPEPEM